VLKEVLVHTSDEEEEEEDSEQEGGVDESGEEEEEYFPSAPSHSSTPRLILTWRNVRQKKILNYLFFSKFPFWGIKTFSHCKLK